MLPDERRRKIVELVTDRGSCTVDTLADRFHVSEATIRRDLQELDDRGMIERSHGGALPAVSRGDEEAYGQKQVTNLEVKRAIGERASREVREGMVVCFDAGTTTMQIARRLSGDESVIAVTNSPPLAMELIDVVGCVKLPGGTLRERTKALVGPSAQLFVRKTNFDLLFVATNAIDVEAGLTTPNEEEAHVKQLMIEQAERVVLVADGSKLGTQSFVKFASLEDVDAFVTDARLSEREREEFDRADVHVIKGVSG